MRRFMKRNYKGSDHLGAAADYEDRKLLSGAVQSNECNSEGADSLTDTLPSSASAITAEPMSMDEISEKEQLDIGTTHSSVNDDQLQHSSAADQ
jgi:hypothetical protein